MEHYGKSIGLFSELGHLIYCGSSVTEHSVNLLAVATSRCIFYCTKFVFGREHLSFWVS